MMKLLVCLAVFHISVFAFATDDKAAEIINLEKTVEYVNSFDTVGEYLNELKMWSLINDDERAAVIAFLEKNKISLTEKIAPATKSSFEVTKDGLKLGSGLIVKVGAGRKFDDVFAEIFNEGKAKKTSLYSFVVPTADAQALGQTRFLRTAIEGSYYHTMKTLSTIVQGLGAVGTNFFGFIAAAWRNLQAGSITCDEFGGYEVRLGFTKADWERSYNRWLESRRANSAGTPDRETMLDGYSAEVAAAMMAGKDMIEHDIDFNRAGETIVSQELLRRTFPVGAIPTCNPQRARSVQNELRQASRTRGEAMSRRIREQREARQRNLRGL